MKFLWKMLFAWCFHAASIHIFVVVGGAAAVLVVGRVGGGAWFFFPKNGRNTDSFLQNS